MTSSVKRAKPAERYEDLLKQFSALKTLLVCTEARLAYYEKERRLEHLARVQLESERAANEILKLWEIDYDTIDDLFESSFITFHCRFCFSISLDGEQ